MSDSRMHWKKAVSQKSSDNTDKRKKRPWHNTIEVLLATVQLKQLPNELLLLIIITVRMHLCT